MLCKQEAFATKEHF